jgi:hypothetical protein
MRIATFCAVALLSTALCACATASPQPRIASANCAGLPSTGAVRELLAPGNIQSVEPIHTTQFLARAIQPTYVSGANLYVLAQPGLNEAYVERVLTCHAASGTAVSAHDPLLAEGVTDVDVSAQGPTLRIAILGANRAAGKDILRRARALQQLRGEVSVEQLSALPVPAL